MLREDELYPVTFDTGLFSSLHMFRKWRFVYLPSLFSVSAVFPHPIAAYPIIDILQLKENIFYSLCVPNNRQSSRVSYRPISQSLNFLAQRPIIVIVFIFCHPLRLSSFASLDPINLGHNKVGLWYGSSPPSCPHLFTQ